MREINLKALEALFSKSIAQWSIHCGPLLTAGEIELAARFAADAVLSRLGLAQCDPSSAPALASPHSDSKQVDLVPHRKGD